MGKLISDKFAAWQEECEQRFQQLKANEEELNRIFIDIYGLQDELTPEVEDKDVTVRRADLTREIIRNYFLKDFFADHCKIYQKRPIYWMFDSGKKNGFKALVYLHRWDADTTGRVYNNYLSPLLRTYAQQIVQENNVISSSNDARTVSTAQKRLDKLKLQQEECEKYEKNIAHLAALRITLDLDDGVKVNYVKAQTAADGKNLNVLAPIK